MGLSLFTGGEGWGGGGRRKGGWILTRHYVILTDAVECCHSSGLDLCQGPSMTLYDEMFESLE